MCLSLPVASAEVIEAVKGPTGKAVQLAIDGLTLRDVVVDWDRQKPGPKWGSALVLRDISNLVLQDSQGQAAQPAGPLPAIVESNVIRAKVVLRNLNLIAADPEAAGGPTMAAIEGGRFVGLLTPGTMGEFLMIRRARPEFLIDYIYHPVPTLISDT